MIRLETETVERLLHENQEFADYFLSHLLTRTARVEADLVDQLFNSSKMRLARALLLLANYGNDRGLEPVAVKVDHDTLAALIGTTRSRVNVFSRVEDGRGSLGHSATPPFPIPAHQTGRADFRPSGFPTSFTVRHTTEAQCARA